MGQSRLGAAILHHLDGVMVQSLDLSTLVSDSTRSPEATVAQLFVEAKRHKPSVILIPSLKVWCDTVTESVRGTMTALLDSSLESNDAVMLMAIGGIVPLTSCHLTSAPGFGFTARESYLHRDAFTCMFSLKLTSALDFKVMTDSTANLLLRDSQAH